MRHQRWTVVLGPEDEPFGDDDRNVPHRGDYLISPRAVYRVVDSWPLDTNPHENRWRVIVERAGTNLERYQAPAEFYRFAKTGDCKIIRVR